MAEIIIQFLTEILLVIPGAFIRWIFLHRQKSFKEIVFEKSIYNYILSVILIATTALMIVFI